MPMTVKPTSQNARILRVLADGRWHTSAALHRSTGTGRLNSRISDLRKQGFRIEHERLPGKVGALGHRYRLLNPPRDLPVPPSPTAGRLKLDRDATPRDHAHRYRLYRLVYDELELVATARTPEEVGTVLVRLGREGEFRDSCVGCLDTFGTDKEPGQWILSPWEQQGT